MRTLDINKRELKYSLFSQEVEEVDSSGFKTGRHVISYATPVTIYENIREDDSSTFMPYGIQDKKRVTITLSKDYGWDRQTMLEIKGEKYIVKKIDNSPNGIKVVAEYAD